MKQTEFWPDLAELAVSRKVNFAERRLLEAFSWGRYRDNEVVNLEQEVFLIAHRTPQGSREHLHHQHDAKG